MKSNKLFGLSFLSLASIMALVACGGGSSSESGSGSQSSTPSAGATYTYNTYLDSNPKTWNPHAWETNSDSYILAYTQMGFYDLGFNEDKSGYEFLCEMASEMPVDVTKELSKDEKTRFFGRSSVNLPSGVAYDIKLNQAATWEDGTPIKASDYVESMKRLLNPKFVNHRADSFYKGSTVLANAEAYFKNGQQTIEPAYNYIASDANLDPIDDSFCSDGTWFVNLGGNSPYAGQIFSNLTEGAFYTVLNNRSSTLSSNIENAADRITNAVGEALIKIRRDGWLDGAISYSSSDWKNVETISDITTPSTDSTEENMWDFDISMYDFDELDIKVAGGKIVNEAELEKNGEDLPDSYDSYLWEDLQADISTFVKGLGSPRGIASKENSWRLPLFAHYDNDSADIPFEDVGIEAIDDYTLRLVMAQDSPVSLTDLKFSLTSSWLVDATLYDKLTTQVAGTNLMATKYGTASAENYKSFGPYKLTAFQSNKLITIEKNDKWYGWSDGKHEGQFQMEVLKTQIVAEHTTAMQQFEKGEIDDIELTTSDMKKYGASTRLQYTPTSYTQKLSFNVTRSQLLKRQKNAASSSHPGNKTILANEDFRKAVSLGIDRTQFAAQCTAGSQGFTGLLNNLYISDVDNGEFYRGTSQAKAVYNKIYGHLGGSTIDEENGEALAERSRGYNAALAAQYLKKAIETEVADVDNEGHFEKGNTVAIEILVYKTDSETTVASYNFIKNALTSLAEAANKLLGDNYISFDYYMTPNEDYYDEAKKGNYDCIFSTWGGAQMDPYGLMEVYCDSSFDSNCEYGMTTNVKKIELTFDYDNDGTPDTKTMADWYSFLSKLNEISEADYDMDDPEEVAKYEKAKYQRHQERLNILSELEAGYINTWSTAPVISRSSASLTSYKVEYGTDQYIPLMGYGGVRYMTFTYSDAEWADAIKTGKINADLYKQ
ncbi:MAG: hypothetical protein K6B65_05395 [Bacilli bacterium]|nr:hypothetical protein [Bacilli bacterium]